MILLMIITKHIYEVPEFPFPYFSRFLFNLSWWWWLVSHFLTLSIFLGLYLICCVCILIKLWGNSDHYLLFQSWSNPFRCKKFVISCRRLCTCDSFICLYLITGETKRWLYTRILLSRLFLKRVELTYYACMYLCSCHGIPYFELKSTFYFIEDMKYKTTEQMTHWHGPCF